MGGAGVEYFLVPAFPPRVFNDDGKELNLITL